MPELPEVETIKRRLATVLPGKEITAFRVNRARSFRSETPASDIAILSHTTVESLSRRGKFLHIHLDNDHSLTIHLMMSGQLIYREPRGNKSDLEEESNAEEYRIGGGHPSAAWVEELPNSHTRIEIDFSDGSQLFFNDMRVFGYITLDPREEIETHYADYGPDINDPTLTTEYLHAQLQRRSIPIKRALLINQIVSGLGNIYVCDTLHAAQIDPRRPARELSLDEVSEVLDHAQQVISRAIELSGTTYDGLYVDVDGFAGGYQEEMRVYNREGEPCQVCGTAIEKIRLGQRGTYFCPSCQSS